MIGVRMLSREGGDHDNKNLVYPIVTLFTTGPLSPTSSLPLPTIFRKPK